MERHLEAPRLDAALARLRTSKLVLATPARPTPFAFPLMVEMFRESLTNEALETRVARMVAELEAAAANEWEHRAGVHGAATPIIRGCRDRQSIRPDGQVALVTGAYRGLGEAIAAGLAQAGATVVYNGRKPAALATAAAALNGAGLMPRRRCSTSPTRWR